MPSRLNLGFTIEPDIVEKMNFMCLLGKSHCALIDFATEKKVYVKRDEQNKVGSNISSKAKYNELRKFLKEAYCKPFCVTENTQNKWMK